jgi:TonB family protein
VALISRLPVLVVLSLTPWAVRVSSQSALPSESKNTLIIGTRSIRQPARDAPLRITLVSGDRLTVPPADVHEAATDVVRSAASRQTNPPVQPDHILVLRIREIVPDRDTRVRVTLSSGTTIRMRAADAYDARLTFLRTELLQAISAANAAAARAGAGTLQGSSAAVSSDASVQFAAKDPESAAWLKDFMKRLRRAWMIPVPDSALHGIAKVSFNVQRDGTITDVTLAASSALESLDKAAIFAVTACSPVAPLPSNYPDRQAFLTVTFYYNETPR